MFTTAGQTIIAKYMTGQVPAFGSYIAVGCGPNPTNSLGTDAYTPSGALLFESFRAKVISRGFTNEAGSLNLSLIAEMPTEERYEITELGLYPSLGNDSAGAADSRVLLRFNDSELWKKNGTIDTYKVVNPVTPTISAVAGSNDILSVPADNPGFQDADRITRLEVPRFLTKSIFIKGDSTNNISLSGLNLDLSQSAPSDLLKLAYSIVSDSHTNSTSAGPWTITVKLNNDSGAYFSADFITKTGNGYGAAVLPISSLVSHSSGGTAPTLKGITSATISITSSDTNKADYWICLDGMRIDNVSFNSSIYNLVAYKQINTGTDPRVTIIKDANTSNFIEFKFSLGVS